VLSRANPMPARVLSTDCADRSRSGYLSALGLKVLVMFTAIICDSVMHELMHMTVFAFTVMFSLTQANLLGYLFNCCRTVDKSRISVGNKEYY